MESFTGVIEQFKDLYLYGASTAIMMRWDLLCVLIGISLAQLYPIVRDCDSLRITGEIMQEKQVVTAEHRQVHVTNLTLCTANTAPLLHVIVTADEADAVATTLRVTL